MNKTIRQSTKKQSKKRIKVSKNEVAWAEQDHREDDKGE